MARPSISSISVLIPALNEEQVIGRTIQRVKASLGRLNEVNRIQFIIVSDGSTDRTFDEASASLQHDDAVIVQLLSNVGSHAAIRCGLRYASGDVTVIMAADGQDPPEALPEMLSMFAPGVDVVWAQRASRANDPRSRRLFSKTYYAVFRVLTGLNYPPGGFDFVVVSSRAVDSLLQFRERNTSLFLLLFNLGYGQASITYERGERQAGTSGWTFAKRIKLAMDMLTAFSAAPLRLVSMIGFLVGLLGLAFGSFTIVRALLGDVPVEGWASLMVIASLMGGLTLVALGLLGEYVWRTLEESRQRPIYFEDRRVESAGSGSRAIEDG